MILRGVKNAVAQNKFNILLNVTDKNQVSTKKFLLLLLATRVSKSCQEFYEITDYYKNHKYNVVLVKFVACVQLFYLFFGVLLE